MTHICVGNRTIIGSDNGLSPGRHQAIIWTSARILAIGPLRIKFSEILIEIHISSIKKKHLKISSGQWRPFCPGLSDNILHNCNTINDRVSVDDIYCGAIFMLNDMLWHAYMAGWQFRSPSNTWYQGVSIHCPRPFYFLWYIISVTMMAILAGQVASYVDFT